MSWLRRRRTLDRLPARVLSLCLLVLLVIPVVALTLSSSPTDIVAGVRHPLFLPALSLSARTTLTSLVFVVLTGTPLAWWLATEDTRRGRMVEIAVDLPIVLPPAVVGVALLQAFGRSGLVGPQLEGIGLRVPFTTVAVIIAQIVVSAPFYVRAATNAFRKVDADLVVVARSLGASPSGAFFRVAIPIALPGLVSGAALAWARSIGEFGATLLFAGNLAGRTQTMPLAILTALESDVRAALAISLFLAAVAVVLLFSLRLVPRLVSRNGSAWRLGRRRNSRGTQ